MSIEEQLFDLIKLQTKMTDIEIYEKIKAKREATKNLIDLRTALCAVARESGALISDVFKILNSPK